MTHYAGCRFRSDLDARWAVFLDRLDVTWRYESRQIDLPSGARYQPTFYLPDLTMWAVAESDENGFLRDGRRHAEAAHHLRTGLLILGPMPDVTQGNPQHLALARHDRDGAKPVLCIHVAWPDMLADRGMVTEIGLPCTDQETEDIDLPSLGSYSRGGYGWTQPPPVVGEGPLEWAHERAYRAARAAQFGSGATA